MKEPQWLLQSVVLALHAILLDEHGGTDGLRDAAGLASALDRAKNKWSYKPKTTMFEMAAAYSFALAKNHPFIDGNKRVAFLSGTVFLELNGYEFYASEAEAAVVFENLAAGNLEESELATWFKANSKKQ